MGHRISSAPGRGPLRSIGGTQCRRRLPSYARSDQPSVPLTTSTPRKEQAATAIQTQSRPSPVVWWKLIIFIFL